MGKSFSLKRILISFIITVVSLSILAVSVFAFRLFSDTMTDKIAESRIDVLSQISERVSSIKDTIVIISNVYYYNHTIFEYYDGEVFLESEEEDFINQIQQLDQLTKGIVQSVDIEYDYLFALSNGFSYSSVSKTEGDTLNDLEKELWLNSIYQGNGRDVWVSTHKMHDEYVFSLGRSIIDPNTGESIGIFLFNIKEKNIKTAFSQLIDQNEIYILDTEGNIISHTNERMLGINFYHMEAFDEMFGNNDYQTIEKNQKIYLFSKYPIEKYNWIVVEEIPLMYLLAPLDYIKNYMMISGFLILLISSFFIYLALLDFSVVI